MFVRFVVIGKPTREYAVLIGEYEKRLPKYCRFEAFEVKGEKDLLPKVKGRLVLLDKSGVQLSSEGLADLLKRHDQLTFAIGSDVGFSEELKRKADFVLSFSKMTFPHQLARLMLTEQVYRAFTILKGEKYHK